MAGSARRQNGGADGREDALDGSHGAWRGWIDAVWRAVRGLARGRLGRGERETVVLLGSPDQHRPTAAPAVDAARVQSLERRVHELEKEMFELRGGWRVDVVERLANHAPLDEGLRLDRVWEERDGDRRLILVEYTDERRPDVLLGFWWDVAAEPGIAFESDGDVAGYLRIWLQEAFHAGGPMEERPVDAEGRRWTWPGPLPAPLPPGR